MKVINQKANLAGVAAGLSLCPKILDPIVAHPGPSSGQLRGQRFGLDTTAHMPYRSCIRHPLPIFVWGNRPRPVWLTPPRRDTRTAGCLPLVLRQRYFYVSARVADEPPTVILALRERTVLLCGLVVHRFGG
jgi:hypothetical protein